MQLGWLTGWVIVSVLLGLGTSVQAGSKGDSAAVCKRAASKMDRLIVDWHAYVVEFKAEAKNPSVLKMMAEHNDIFTCFAGTTTELGAALCHQTDTNRNHWQYHRP